MALGDIAVRLKHVYDKLIAGVVLIGLVASLAYLAWHADNEQTAQETFIAKIDAICLAHPEAEPVDVAPYEAALVAVRRPSRIAAGEAAPDMWLPGTRVQCVDCRRPIPYEAEQCAFCRARQPVDPKDDPDRDLDQDGIKDVWELRYGLDPRNPNDAEQDNDGDDFTNIEEFLAAPPTDPSDADDSPSIVMKLCVKSLVADPFHLRFKSVIRMPGGKKQFAINTRGDSKTYFKKVGEEVEGFEVFKYAPKYRRVRRFGREMQIDISVLTLKRGEKLIGLTKGKGVEYDEYICTLQFTVDDSTYKLRLHDEFELQGKRYELIDIDSDNQRVVIKRVLDGLELQVRQCAEGDEAGLTPEPSSSTREQGVNS